MYQLFLFKKEEKLKYVPNLNDKTSKNKHGLTKIDLKKLILAIHILPQDRGCSLSVFPSKDGGMKNIENEFIRMDLYRNMFK